MNTDKRNGVPTHLADVVRRFIRAVDIERDDYDGNCRCAHQRGWCQSCAAALSELEEAVNDAPLDEVEVAQ